MKILSLVLTVILGFASLSAMATEKPRSSSIPESIEVKELSKILSEKPKAQYLIDVRTDEEWKEVHASPAIHIPMDQVSPEVLQKHAISKEDTLYIICASGGRSSKVVSNLKKQGYSNVVNVTGGTQAWLAAKLPSSR